MVRKTLTGSRIRERRIASSIRQADLAKRVGISASYLNLIEHNRRKIGGKLLVDIASILGVEPGLLADGAETSVLNALREAAARMPEVDPELDRADEFAGRFPGWAGLVAASFERITKLERSVEILTDRMTHDPHLADSLHEMLTAVTAIQSSASILNEPGEIDPEWQARFHRNIAEDSARLAEASRGLVSYLGADDTENIQTGTAQEELHDILDRVGHYVAGLEEGEALESVAERLTSGTSPAAALLVHTWLQRYQNDVRQVPLGTLKAGLAADGLDPVCLARRFQCDPAVVMRRLAAAPPEILPRPVGLAICDSSGVLIYRKPITDFQMPRVGAACPLWPLYRALSQPYTVISQTIQQVGRGQTVYQASAVALQQGGWAVQGEGVFEATMVVLPVTNESPSTRQNIAEIGLSCRICPRQSCAGRREPSLLA